MRHLLFSIILLCSCNFSPQTSKPPAVNIPLPERIRTYDVQHIKINVNFDWNEKKVIGNVETRIVPLADDFKEFEVDAAGFKINYIKGKENNNLNYSNDGKKIKIILDKPYSVNDTIVYSVDYTCKPQRGLFFIYPTDLNPSLPYQIWTQGEAEDNHHWIPVYDYPNDKTTWEIYLTVDDKYKTISNGFLDFSGKISDKNERQDHWVMDKPNSTYLIMLAAGDFNIVQNKSDTLPVYSYVDKNILFNNAEYSFRNVPAMIKFFSNKFAHEYPWNKYSQVVVEDFIFTGMENTSAAVLNIRAVYPPEIENDYTSDPLLSHELSHQWFGDLVTCQNWRELWLNESFATFFSALWKENYYGKDTYDYGLLLNGDDALRADSVTGRMAIWGGYGSISANTYDKGSVILKTFRDILGEDFFRALKTYLTDNKYKNVTSNDLLNAINKQYNLFHNTNEDFKWMFDQWIWKGGYPVFNVDYNYDENSKQLQLNVKQIQKPDSLTPLFRMPVNIRLKSDTEDRIERIQIFDEDETFKMNMNSNPQMVVFDYGKNILDKIYFDKPFDDWKMQFEVCENAVDRIMALRGLEKFLEEDKSEVAGKPPITINQISALKLFEDALTRDKFWGVRAEAVKILGRNFIIDRTSSILKNSYEVQTDSRIKREILKALGNSKRSEDADFIKEKIKNELNNYIVASGITALGKCLPADQVYDAVNPYADKITFNNVIQTAVIEALDSADEKVSDARIKKTIMNIAFGIDIEGRLRTNAINALRTYAADEDVKNLARKNIDFNFMFVKRALITLLGNSNDKSVIEFLQNTDKGTTDQEMSKIIQAAIKKLSESK